LVAFKDFYQEQHSDALPVHNLEVLCLMRSLRSKGFVKETYNWRYYYYVLTPEGIDYLRQYLALPQEVVPGTVQRAATRKPAERPERGDRQKRGDPGSNFNPEFEKTRPAREGYRS
jgi:small subunit ribosomal protein S10e